MEFPQIILFISNDHSRLESSISAIEQAGHIILTAFDGNEGLLVAQNDRPDLIISEFELGDMCGIELCKILRANEEFSDIPIILINEPKQNVDNVLSAFREGANDYLSICCDPTYLVTKIMCHLEQKLTKSNFKRSYQVLRKRQHHINEIIKTTSELIVDLDVEYRNTVFSKTMNSELEKNFGKRIESGINIVESLVYLLEEQAISLDVLANEFNSEKFNDEKLPTFLKMKKLESSRSANNFGN